MKNLDFLFCLCSFSKIRLRVTVTMSQYSKQVNANNAILNSSNKVDSHQQPQQIMDHSTTADGIENDSISISIERKEAEELSLSNNNNDNVFQWTIGSIILAIVLFVAAGVAEILGGWFVWKSIRSSTTTTKKPYWWGIIGCILLIIYGYIPTLQPTNSFGRIYAVYGGFFILLSFVFGWLLDGDQPDLGDVIGGSISLVGVLLILFWPR